MAFAPAKPNVEGPCAVYVMPFPTCPPDPLEHALPAWRATHALGPYQHLHFERQVVPILLAACAAYRAHPGQAGRMWRQLMRELARQPALHAKDEELHSIAHDCWEDLQRAAHRAA